MFLSGKVLRYHPCWSGFWSVRFLSRCRALRYRSYWSGFQSVRFLQVSSVAISFLLVWISVCVPFQVSSVAISFLLVLICGLAGISDIIFNVGLPRFECRDFTLRSRFPGVERCDIVLIGLDFGLCVSFPGVERCDIVLIGWISVCAFPFQVSSAAIVLIGLDFRFPAFLQSVRFLSRCQRCDIVLIGLDFGLCVSFPGVERCDIVLIGLDIGLCVSFPGVEVGIILMVWIPFRCRALRDCSLVWISVCAFPFQVSSCRYRSYWSGFRCAFPFQVSSAAISFLLV